MDRMTEEILQEEGKKEQPSYKEGNSREEIEGSNE
jgi:hypothetical protein